MTRAEAIEAARAWLEKEFPTAPPTIVLREEWAEEYDWAWQVVFDTQEYLDSGNRMLQLLDRRLFVRKDTGAVDHVPSALAAKQTVYFLTTGIFPPPPESEL